MKKITVLAILMIFAAQASQAQTAYTEKRQVSGFDEVSFALSGEVYISLGSGYSVELEGDRDYLKEIITEVDGDNLKIKTEKWFNTGNKKVIVRITMPALDGLSISGSGKVTVNDPLKGENLDVAISGSGKIYLRDVALGDVECSISGSGSLIVAGSGTIKSFEMSVSGSGDYLGEATRVGTLVARISGSGNCDCHVTDMLRASISGSGSIYYSGNPKIDASVSGSGKVRMK
ncbi:MAG: DUF2807 domain-containing protein [Bacteroidales bacterium]|jgi:hypothetical protein|nr:DUF2807 domain-containing protein [Bacteroidales bacterium]